MGMRSHVRRSAAARLLGSAGAVALAVSLVACDSDPVDTHGEEHIDGVAMYAGGVQIHAYRKSVHGLTPPPMNLEAGRTYDVSLQWLDGSGEAMDVSPAPALEVTIVQPGLLTWTQTGPASGTLETIDLLSGSVQTSMRVVVFHGGEEGHADVDTGNFTVNIAP